VRDLLALPEIVALLPGLYPGDDSVNTRIKKASKVLENFFENPYDSRVKLIISSDSSSSVLKFGTSMLYGWDPLGVDRTPTMSDSLEVRFTNLFTGLSCILRGSKNIYGFAIEYSKRSAAIMSDSTSNRQHREKTLRSSVHSAIRRNQGGNDRWNEFALAAIGPGYHYEKRPSEMACSISEALALFDAIPEVLI
jgi:hypothetical protein